MVFVRGVVGPLLVGLGACDYVEDSHYRLYFWFSLVLIQV